MCVGVHQYSNGRGERNFVCTCVGGSLQWIWQLVRGTAHLSTLFQNISVVEAIWAEIWNITKNLYLKRFISQSKKTHHSRPLSIPEGVSCGVVVVVGSCDVRACVCQHATTRAVSFGLTRWEKSPTNGRKRKKKISRLFLRFVTSTVKNPTHNSTIWGHLSDSPPTTRRKMHSRG